MKDKLERAVRLQIDGRIPSKKNSRMSAGRFTIASNKYREWAFAAGVQLMEYKGWLLSDVSIRFEFWMPDKRRCDLDNKVTSVFDVLKDLEIIQDDSWQCVPEFNVKCKGIDRDNPRVIIWLELQ